MEEPLQARKAQTASAIDSLKRVAKTPSDRGQSVVGEIRYYLELIDRVCGDSYVRKQGQRVLDAAREVYARDGGPSAQERLNAAVETLHESLRDLKLG